MKGLATVAGILGGVCALGAATVAASAFFEQQRLDQHQAAIAADDAAPHQWWVAKAWPPNQCFDDGSPADELQKQETSGLQPFVKEERDASGFRTSVAMYTTGGNTHVTFFRDLAECEAANFARYQKDCKALNDEGTAMDCDAPAASAPDPRQYQ